MTDNLSIYSVDKLREMYNGCKDGCSNSEYPLIIALMNKTVNDRVQILQESSLDTSLIDKDTIDELVNGKYATLLSSQSKLVITAKGLWEVMFRDNICNTSDLIDGIQGAYFNEIKDMTITSSNKIVLFFFLFMRNFSKKCCVDVKRSEIAEIWWNIFCTVNDFLIELGAIKEKDSIRKTKKNINDSESNAARIIRHSDKIPRYTDNIFSKSGDLEYWLDLSDSDGNVDSDRLSKLIKKILGNNITVDNCDLISEFANGVCMDFGYNFVSSFEDDRFLSCNYDSLVCYVFQKSLL